MEMNMTAYSTVH